MRFMKFYYFSVHRLISVGNNLIEVELLLIPALSFRMLKKTYCSRCFRDRIRDTAPHGLSALFFNPSLILLWRSISGGVPLEQGWANFSHERPHLKKF